VADLGAVVEVRVHVPDVGADVARVRRGDDGRVRHDLPGGGVHDLTTVGLPRDQVDRAGSGRAVGRVVVLVAHRVVLRVIPHRRDGVAVVVVHHQARQADVGRGTGGHA